MDLALNNLQGLICHKTQTNKLSHTTEDLNSFELNKDLHIFVKRKCYSFLLAI